MEDIETEETREKCELFKNYYFVSFRSHDNGNFNTADVEPINMYNVVMREGILTVSILKKWDFYRCHPNPKINLGI